MWVIFTAQFSYVMWLCDSIDVKSGQRCLHEDKNNYFIEDNKLVKEMTAKDQFIADTQRLVHFEGENYNYN
jgi:hypothetical protein